jgi:hypothetical protein
MNRSCARTAKEKQRERQGKIMTCRVVRVCISVAVDCLREAEWKVCYLGFGLFVGFGAGRGRGAGRETRGAQFTTIPLLSKWQFPARESTASPAPPADPPRSCPRRRPLVRRAWVSVFQDPTVTSLGRDSTHSNWLRVCFDLASIPSMLDRRHAASHWPVIMHHLVSIAKFRTSSSGQPQLRRSYVSPCP